MTKRLGFRRPRHEITDIHLDENGAIDAYVLDHGDEWYSHNEILKMMANNHVFFYTNNKGQDTRVEAVIKTKGNNTKADNLLSLPQFEFEDEF